MTPNQTAIAREAAEHIRLNNEMTRGGYDSPHTTESIILTAAARMVKESGAVEALEKTAVFYEEDMPDGPQGADLRFVTAAYRDAFEAVLASLAALRALQEPAPARPEK